jgi:hypothetical protein
MEPSCTARRALHWIHPDHLRGPSHYEMSSITGTISDKSVGSFPSKQAVETDLEDNLLAVRKL